MNKKIPIDMRIRLMQQKGFDPKECSSEEWLKLAIESEETQKYFGPFDPSSAHFRELSENYFKLAELREEMDGAKNESQN